MGVSANGINGPIISAFAITPDDASDLPQPTRAIYVGTSGNLKVLMVGDATPVTFLSVPVGLWPWRVKRVYLTGTTAGSLIAQL